MIMIHQGRELRQLGHSMESRKRRGRKILLGTLAVLVGVLAWASLPKTSATQDGEAREFQSYGFDRLLYSWDFDSLNGLTCFNQFQPTPDSGFFCDGTQTTLAFAKDAYIYQQLLEKVVTDPNPDIARLVQQNQGQTVPLQDLYRLTKEQIDLGKGNPDSSITAYFLQRSRGIQDRDLPLTLQLVHAPAKNPEDPTTPPTCAELQEDYRLFHDVRFVPAIGLMDALRDFDQQVDFPNAQQLFEEHPEIYDRVAECWTLPPKEDTSPGKNFVVLLLVSAGENQSYQNPGSIIVGGSDPLLDPEVVPLEDYSLKAEYTTTGGRLVKFGYAISLEAFLRHRPFSPKSRSPTA